MFSYFQEWIITLKGGYLELSLSQPTTTPPEARDPDKEESDMSQCLQIRG